MAAGHDVVPALAPMPMGTSVHIAAVGPGDDLSSQAGALVGKTCTVVESALVSSGVYYSGVLSCDGQRYQFYQVAVVASSTITGGGPPASSPAPAGRVAVGTAIV